MEILLYWWLIGAGSCLLAGLYLNRDNLPFSALTLVLVGSAVLGVLGPILAYVIAKWFWEAWRDQFAIDDTGKRLYPWVRD